MPPAVALTLASFAAADSLLASPGVQYPEHSARSADVVGAARDSIPVDPAVTIGRLENGLTYYIRENRRPAARAELRLVVNAGSILENVDQLGLAHFVEHMAFNGTTHFEKQELVDFIGDITTERPTLGEVA